MVRTVESLEEQVAILQRRLAAMKETHRGELSAIRQNYSDLALKVGGLNPKLAGSIRDLGDTITRRTAIVTKAHAATEARPSGGVDQVFGFESLPRKSVPVRVVAKKATAAELEASKVRERQSHSSKLRDRLAGCAMGL
jgi:hypothetical protein